MSKKILAISVALTVNLLPWSAHAVGTSWNDGNEALSDEVDLLLMTEIRERLTRNEFLSVLGRNVQIQAQDGHVILSGTVPTKMEAATIERTAIHLVGIENVTNQMNIAEY